MHLPIAYESYLNKEIIKHMIASNNGDEYPAWLVLEEETYNWIRNLERKLMFVIWSRIVSKEFLERIGKIPTIRFSRYRDISPSLKEAIITIANEFASLNEDLKCPEMWERQCLLSYIGFKRFERTINIVDKCYHVMPDPEWRDDWEKKRAQRTSINDF